MIVGIVATVSLVYIWSRQGSDLYRPVGVVFLGGTALFFGIAWRREGHGLGAALSWSAPLGIVWIAAFLWLDSRIVSLSVYIAGIAFLFAIMSSDRVVDWWYRTILRSKPPGPR